ncbi:MAG: tyrosine--tRNA ligase [Patescibacteria group bacterium]
MSRIVTDKDKINTLLTRGVEEIIGKEELEKALLSGEKLRIKLGIDPTSPNLHIGRAVPLLKLRDFQELGHQIVFIIGDFTGIIGDTSDKDSERPMLDTKTIKENMKTYKSQAGKILDVKKCEVEFNSKWLKKLTFDEIGEIANIFSVNEFISRELIKKRLDEGKRVSLREVLYPLMQGYDSVAVKADVELGGTDQRFNLLAGRELQRHFKQIPQSIITNPLYPGLDGRKMSSSWGNTINLLDDPKEMFGKVMSLGDELLVEYFTAMTRVPLEEVEKHKTALESGENPKTIKIELGKALVAMYHSEKEAESAAQDFENVFSNKEAPADMPVISLDSQRLGVVELITKAGFASSNSEARRLVEQGAVKYNNEKVQDREVVLDCQEGDVLQVGKRQFGKVSLK